MIEDAPNAPYLRFEAVARHYGLTMRQLSAKIGLSSPQSLYDLKSGKVQRISRKLLESVEQYLPEINTTWLMTGDGNMLVSSSDTPGNHTQVIGTNSGTAINGGSQVPAGADAQFREYVFRKDAQVDELLSQNGRLLRIIERLTEKEEENQ